MLFEKHDFFQFYIFYTFFSMRFFCFLSLFLTKKIMCGMLFGMCVMLFENSKKLKILLRFTHFFQLKNECVACFLKIPKSKNFYWNLLIFFSSKMNVWHAFWKIVHVWHAFWSFFLKNRPCVTCFLKKNRPCFLDFFKKLEIFYAFLFF